MDFLSPTARHLSPNEREQALWDLLNQERYKGYLLLWRISALLDEIWKHDPNFQLKMPKKLTECFLSPGIRISDQIPSDYQTELSKKILFVTLELEEERAKKAKLQEEIQRLKEEIDI